MAWLCNLTGSRSPLYLVLAALAATMVLVACDDAEGQDATATPSPTASTPTATATSTPSTGGGGQQQSSDYDDAYDEALNMALDEDIGSDVDDEYLASIDIDIKPNGEGLPPGSGTHADGAAVFAAQCASCHGENGEGGGPAGNGPQVIISPEEAQDGWQPGEPKVVGNYWPYATTVYDYIRRAMPFMTPGSLTDEEVYQVTAFILAENGVIAEDEVIDQDTLADVEMPNRDNFIQCWPDEQCRPDTGTGSAGSNGSGNDGDDASPTPTETSTETSTPTPTPTSTGTAGGG